MGVKANELGLEKVAEYVESSAKSVVSYRCYRDEHEPDILCQANQAAQS